MILKAYLILALLAVAASAEGYLLWRVYHRGEQVILHEDKGAVAAHDQQTAQQGARDKANDADTIAQLRAELATLKGLLGPPAAAAPPPAPVRLCYARGSDQGRAPGPAPAGAAPTEPPRPADHPGLLGGDQPGDDITADVRALAAAGAINAAYRDAVTAWAIRQSTPLKGTL